MVVKHRIIWYKLAIPFALLIMATAVFAGCQQHKQESVFLNDEIRFYSGDELTEIFQGAKEQFEGVAQIILGSDALYEKIEWEEDGDTQILKTDEIYFTKEEWEKIVIFFDEFQPATIMRYGNHVVGFYCPIDNEGRTAALYYIIAEDELSESGNYLFMYDDFEKIDDHWWLGESYDDSLSNNLIYAESYYEDGKWYRNGEKQE